MRTMISIAVAVLAVAGCGGGDGSNADSGTLSIAITDAAVDGASRVVVTFSAVEIKPAGGTAVVYVLSPAKSIDLLALSGGATAMLLDAKVLPAGQYQWVRLVVESQQNVPTSYIELASGAQHPLFVPSGEESGLKLNRGFTIAAGGRTDFTIDFDLRKSVIAPRGQAPNYLLKPVLRIVDNLRVGTVSGVVPANLIPTVCTPFIYVFSGANVIPDDLDPAASPDVDPLVSVRVELDSASGAFKFKIPFLEVGTYTLAFTCDGAMDTPDGEETLSFSPTVNVTVNANQTTTLNF